MEEEEEQPLTPAQPSSPFWLQTTTRSSRLRNTFGIFVLNTTFLVLLLSISAIAFLSIQTPSLLLFAQRVLRPSSVKRGWDSLNLLLVLFAVVCGFLGRKDDQDRSSIEDAHVQGSTDATPRSVVSEQSSNWYNYGLRRSFRSYPDLRQEMLFQYDPRPRSYDDSYVRSPRFFTSLETSRSQKVDDRQEKNDGFYGKKLPSEDSAPATEPQEPPPPLPSPSDNLSSEVQTRQESTPSIRRKSRRTRRSEPREAQSPPPARSTSPLPSSAVVQQALEEQSATSTPKKRGGMTKELISSIYHQSKRKKKQRRRSHENLEDFDQITNPNPSFPTPSPPPPPPPPPTRFHNIFSTKKGKPGKQSSSDPPHPPPPPPRQRSIDRIILKSSSSVTSKANAYRTKLDLMEQISGEGSESPLTRIPPPPPPPPFKFRSWKFAVEGDYVKIASSGGGESEIEESDTGTPVAGENTPSLLTCPSPDVNLKADDFIARFRSKLKLEKMNSIKQKQEMGSGFSPLGPDSSPSPN